MEKYIEWDLKNNPDFFKKPQTGRYVDTGVLRHVIANVNCPEELSDADFFLALNAVAEEVDYIPRADVAPVVHGHPIYHNRPVYYERYEMAARGENGEPLYRRKCSLLQNNPVAYCSRCGKRLCSNFEDYCPACGAKIDGRADNGGIH